MFKKFILIVTIVILLTPISFVTGNNLKSKDEGAIENIKIQTDIDNLLDQVDESTLSYYLEKFVSFGFKMTGSENLSRAADWIKQEFEEIGLHTYFDEWKFPKYRDKNVIALHNGTDPSSDAVIVVCAHYDTIGGSPGANDDGTGVAAILTIANITSKHSFNHTIRFIATSGEEVGTYGSFADAKKAYKQNENIIGVINIDTIGYSNSTEDGKILQMFASERSRNLINFGKEISKKYESQTGIKLQYCTNYPADCESYYDYGFDGIQFIHPKPEAYHWMHTPEDTLDKINYTYHKKATKLLLAITCELANKAIDLQVRIIKPFVGYAYLKNIPLLKLPCFNLYSLRSRAMTYIFGKTSVEIDIKTDEEINSVYFAIDGYTRHADNEPPYEYKIGGGKYGFFRLKGHHRLSVCVATNTGKTAYDEMDIFVVKLI